MLNLYIYIEKANGQCVLRRHHRVLSFPQQMCQRAMRLLAGLLPCQETEKDDISTLIPHTQISLSLSVSVFPSHHALYICRELWNEMGKITQEPLILCVDGTECWRVVMRAPWVHLVQFLRKLICVLKTDKHFISLWTRSTNTLHVF